MKQDRKVVSLNPEERALIRLMLEYYYEHIKNDKVLKILIENNKAYKSLLKKVEN